ncbi:MAG: hypothetical protein COA94_00845 [Rickettsiales bacterium]|nr:MAG: hypothetical protein COA94_00845 [Rickettsiales bacterium]
MSLILKRLVIFLIYISPLSYHALSDERLRIDSDNLTIKKDDSSASFTGSVEASFNDYKLTTSKLTILYGTINGKKDIVKIVIPSKLKLIKPCSEEIAIADRGIFDNKTKKLTLTGNVMLQQKDNILATDKLVYSGNFKAINHKK